MVEETIKAIRETEAAADVIVKEAGEKSQKILEDARQEAERMIKSPGRNTPDFCTGCDAGCQRKSQGISGRGPCADRERNQGVKGVCCPERSGGSECSDFSVSVVKRN